MRLQYMAQKSSFPDTIDGKAMRARTNAHPQNSFSGKVTLKTTQVFLKTSYQLYRPIGFPEESDPWIVKFRMEFDIPEEYNPRQFQ